MANRLFERLLGNLHIRRNNQYNGTSYVRNTITGGIFKVSNARGNADVTTIKNLVSMMRELAKDPQVATALAYYATDATTMNTSNQIIWATSDENGEVAGIINSLFKKWKINSYVRSHMLELATVGNLYMPTTNMYRDNQDNIKRGVALDNNTIPDSDFEIVPSTIVPPEDILHLWQHGKPLGYLYQPDSEKGVSYLYPESAVIHFSLGGLLGEYTYQTSDISGVPDVYDIMFADPMMESAITPTQTLNLLEDAILLSSFIKVVRIVSVDCNDVDEDEIQNTLQQVKDAIEQQLSINTATGDAQSFLNPSSPNNLIYVPKVNGTEPIAITDLNMSPSTEADNKLLEYYQDKKLSVLGVPKESMNYSSNEGLGGAGTVMAQRSAVYANNLDRIMTAYKAGWTDAFNTYFTEKGMSGLVDTFELHMNPIITMRSTIQFEKRDATLNQALSLVNLLQQVGVKDSKSYLSALVEILSEVFPQMGADAANWRIDAEINSEGGGPVGL